LIYQFRDSVLDTAAFVLMVEGRPVHLSPKALELLVYLIENHPRAVTKQEIHDRIWPETFVVEANLPVLIREIRQAIRDDQREVIRTVHGRGYAFGGELRQLDHTEESPDFRNAHCLQIDDRIEVLKSGENLVGRDPGADISLPWTTVSRHHAIVRVDGQAASVVDLGSKNGTKVSGRPVEGPTTLHDGVTILFGKVQVTYRFGDWEAETATSGGSSAGPDLTDHLK